MQHFSLNKRLKNYVSVAMLTSALESQSCARNLNSRMDEIISIAIRRRNKY